jgi:myo-inositol-1(or 4)-monophosphatase
MSSIDNLILSIKDLVVNKLPEINLSRYSIEYKEDGSPVTQSDKMLENDVKSILQSQLPDLKFIGEESFDFKKRDGDRGYLAILDPIDGTENFCSGLKEWGVSLGIWQEGKHVGSLLMMPELGESLRTGQKIEKVNSRITGFSSSFTEEIAEGIRDSVEYRVTGCAVYNIFNVIRGSFSRFVNPKGAYIWDLLPGIMLALENGCEVLIDDQVYDGKLLDPTKKYRIDIRHR